MSKWLKECYSSVDHYSCHDKPPRKKFQLPSRVIDVGPSNGSRAPYLLEPNGSYGSYVVLSHCWGNYQPFVTNSETLKQNLKYISLLSLPKTFRDAIYITRGLGIRYLWVDSLCILQGDAVDWESESANMIRIYQNATLALAATAAADSRQGCCFKRQLSSLNSILEAPLNQRAWVLQELLLSSRVIHFAQDQMYWQYSSRLASEDGLLDNKLVEWWDVDISRDYWWTIVEEYSRRSLTHRRDRLPALAGLTEFFQIRTGDSPLAGLWQEDLLFGLMWHVREPVESPVSSDIPSWSWASIEGSI
ncbi:HET-domain-containing protein, partial [Hyaloscypha bicolor E]